MFTFGREHERRCAVGYVRNPDNAWMAVQVVDAVHDLLEGKTSEATASATISRALLEGSSGVWEQAGSWLAKLSHEYPSTAESWTTLLATATARQRFRLAAFVVDLPETAMRQLLPPLLNDKSSKVRNKVVGDLWVEPRVAALDYLEVRLPEEPDPEIASQTTEAIQALRSRLLQ